MEFSFDVDPEQDIAVGTELTFDEQDVVYEDGEEPFDISGYDPLCSTEAKPGSDEKVKMLAARYSAGVPLWHGRDCYDHGPDASLLLGMDGEQSLINGSDEDE